MYTVQFLTCIRTRVIPSIGYGLNYVKYYAIVVSVFTESGCLFYRCNGCNMIPIEGPRFHCQVCADFDFCQNCFDKGQSHNHAFERIDDHGQAAVYVGSPRSRKKALRSLFKQ